MFGSQALDTVIGLVLMFFVIALASSSLMEIVSRLLSKRSKSLESAIGAILAGTWAGSADVQAALDMFRGTTVYDAAKAAAGKSTFRRRWKRPSYISAKGFADAIGEMSAPNPLTLVANAALPAAIRARVDEIITDGATTALEVKAGLEHHFDRTMERMSGAYKRWSTGFLFGFGLMIAVSANASVFHVADELWTNAPLREAVADSADTVIVNGQDAIKISSVEDADQQLEALKLPVGWTDSDRAEWGDRWWQVWKWNWHQTGQAAGWLGTALLVMLGAPFWFEVLTKAVSLRSSGSKPESAIKDATSATAAITASGTASGPATG
jgi:hypothetical protein